jgi:hypothetical protein
MCKDTYRNEIQRVLAESLNQVATTIEEELVAKHFLASSYRQSGNIEASYKCLKEIIETILCVNGEDHAFKSNLFLDAVFRLASLANALGHQEERTLGLLII